MIVKETLKQLQIGLFIRFSSKIHSKNNRFFRLIAPENAKIVVKWYGFVLDGCHQGNNLRIVDGPKSVIFFQIELAEI